MFSIAALGLPLIMCVHVLQFGQGYLTPNNPNTVPSVVKYGYSASNLEFTETGFAEVMLTHLPACNLHEFAFANYAACMPAGPAYCG